MKRLTAILLTLLILLLAGCSTSKTQKIRVNMVDYTVDTQKHTISDGTHTYRYYNSGWGDEDNWTKTVTVQFPDGSTYHWTERDDGGIIADDEGWSEDYDPERYVSGGVLKTVLEKVKTQKRGVQVDAAKLVAAILVTIIGVVGICFPTLGFYLRYGLYVENAEPSDFYIFMARIGGGISVIIGVVLAIQAFL